MKETRTRGIPPEVVIVVHGIAGDDEVGIGEE